MGLALAALVAAGCARHETHETAVSETHASTRNPSSFPLYPSSAVVQVVPVNSAQMFAAIRKSDSSTELPSNFRGDEVIAETTASMAQLRSWIRTLQNAPPGGLRYVPERRGDKGSIDLNTDGNDRDTVVGAQFAGNDGARSVYVIAADPKRLREQLGPVFTLIENYNAVPGVLRGPIDEQAKKQVGYSVSEMLDEKSPVGAVIAQVRRMQQRRTRGILLIDESKAR